MAVTLNNNIKIEKPHPGLLLKYHRKKEPFCHLEGFQLNFLCIYWIQMSPWQYSKTPTPIDFKPIILVQYEPIS